MKLSDYAKLHGIHYQTAYNHFMADKIPGAYRLETGTIIVPDTKIQITIKLEPNKLTDIRNFFLERGWTTTEYKHDFIELE